MTCGTVLDDVTVAFDPDGDGVTTGDNCPNDANPDQANNDGDAQGDVCDPDDDNDGVFDDARSARRRPGPALRQRRAHRPALRAAARPPARGVDAAHGRVRRARPRRGQRPDGPTTSSRASTCAPGWRPCARSRADWRPDVIVRETLEYPGALVAELYDIPLARVGLGLEWRRRGPSSWPPRRSTAPAPTSACPPTRAASGCAGPVPHDGPRGARAPPVGCRAASAALRPARHGRGRSGRLRSAARLVARQRRPARLPHLRLGGRGIAPALLPGPLPRGDRRARAAAGPRPADDRRRPRPRRARPAAGQRPRRALGRPRHGRRARRGRRRPRRLRHDLGTLRDGVPLVVLPLFSLDQWANAAAVAAAGAGIALDAERATRNVLGLPSASPTRWRRCPRSMPPSTRSPRSAA